MQGRRVKIEEDREEKLHRSNSDLYEERKYRCEREIGVVERRGERRRVYAVG